MYIKTAARRIGALGNPAGWYHITIEVDTDAIKSAQQLLKGFNEQVREAGMVLNAAIRMRGKGLLHVGDELGVGEVVVSHDIKVLDSMPGRSDTASIDIVAYPHDHVLINAYVWVDGTQVEYEASIWGWGYALKKAMKLAKTTRKVNDGESAN